MQWVSLTNHAYAHISGISIQMFPRENLLITLVLKPILNVYVGTTGNIVYKNLIP